MKTLILVMTMVCGTTAAAAQPPHDTPTPREAHAAECVAALEVETEALAEQVKAGKDDGRPLLQNHLEAGTAFVGDSYLNGLTDESRARAMARQALEAQKSLTEAQLAARQQACAVEGRRLFDASNALQQAVVKRLARRRMDKLLAP